MRSSSGEYYVGLDHVRAMAVLLVFTWHFLHVNDAHLTPLSGTFHFPLFSLFAEGHIGVSLFMVLSGYLFAKLTKDKKIDYVKFWGARALRLAPLLFAVCIIVLVQHYIVYGEEHALASLHHFSKGLILPTLPNGGWSVAVELHFYLLFPVIILLERRSPFSSLLIIFAALTFRASLAFMDTGVVVRDAAYWTIIGRIDQFLIGILFAYYGKDLVGKHWIAVLVFGLLLAGVYWFDATGGYTSGAFPNVWVFSLTFEALCFATLISYYDRTFKMKNKGVSGLVARIGEASYSIYLLHFFFVFAMANFINENITPIDNIYKGLFFSFLSFIPITLIGWASYNWYERFWLRFRRPYTAKKASTPAPVSSNAVNTGLPA